MLYVNNKGADQLKRPRGRAVSAPTSDHVVAGSNPAGGEVLPEPKRRFIAQSLSCSPFHCLEMTEILLKGHKTLTHPSISRSACVSTQSDQGLCCSLPGKYTSTCCSRNFKTLASFVD